MSGASATSLVVGTTVQTPDGRAGTIVGESIDGLLPVIITSAEPVLLQPGSLIAFCNTEYTANDDDAESDSSADDGSGDEAGEHGHFSSSCSHVNVPKGVDARLCMAETFLACKPSFCVRAELPADQPVWARGYANLWSVLDAVNTAWQSTGAMRLQMAVKGVIEGFGADGRRKRVAELVAAEAFDDAGRRAQARRAQEQRTTGQGGGVKTCVGRAAPPKEGAGECDGLSDRVRGLQRLVERAWADGFDPEGAAARGGRGLHGSAGPAGWIGIREAYAAFCHLRIDARFVRVAGGDAVLSTVASFLESSGDADTPPPMPILLQEDSVAPRAHTPHVCPKGSGGVLVAKRRPIVELRTYLLLGATTRHQASLLLRDPADPPGVIQVVAPSKLGACDYLLLLASSRSLVAAEALARRGRPQAVGLAAM